MRFGSSLGYNTSSRNCVNLSDNVCRICDELYIKTHKKTLHISLGKFTE